MATSAAGGVGFGAGLWFHQYVWVPTDIDVIKVLLSVVVLSTLFSES